MKHPLACLTAFVGLLAGCDDGSTSSTGSHPLPGTTSGGMTSVSSGMGGAGGSMGGAGGMTSTSGASMTSSSSMSSGSSSSSTGSGMGGGCSGGEPTLVTSGSNTKILLQGTVLTPSGPISGEVLINGNVIACVAANCGAMAAGATVVDTHGIISPGLIDAHNHILFDIFDETDWEPPHDGPGGALHAYNNHNQWGSAPGYSEMVDAKQTLNGEMGMAFDLSCELNKFGEMKGLVAGTTSILGASSPPSNSSCYGSLSRTVDQSPNDLPSDKMQVASLNPPSSPDNICGNFASGTTTALVAHVAEGVDTTAHNEFTKLGTITTNMGCLYAPQTAIVHGTALVDADFALMGMHGMSLVWSPRSNVFLYGSGTNLLKTTDIQLALAHGINVSIAPDWSMGGSQNMLDEMRYANYVDDNRWGNMLTPQEIWQMATINPAKAMHLEAFIGSIEVGKRADIAVFVGDQAAPFDAILDATPREVSMVFVDGRLLYGDNGLQGALQPASSTCETLDICCRPKVACIAETTGTPANRLGQTYAQFKAILDQAIVDYDASTPAADPKFAPITPLVRCP